MDNSRQQLKKQVKKHIPKDWLCELRIAYRIVMEAVNDIKRTGIINLVIITTMLQYLHCSAYFLDLRSRFQLLRMNSEMFWKYPYI